MKSISWTKSTWLAVLLLPGLSITVSLAEIPRGEFACQVIAEGGQIGLVVVLANTKAVAEQVALGAKAYTTDNNLSPATSVVQCIRRGAERFTDYQFQQFYESVPR